jgi:hypothetical protein
MLRARAGMSSLGAMSDAIPAKITRLALNYTARHQGPVNLSKSS